MTGQSTHKYDALRQVEPENIANIIEAGRLSHPACNAQPWHFIVVNDTELKNKVADAASARLSGMNHFTGLAPVHILIVKEKVNLSSGIRGFIKDKSFACVDTGIAAAHICPAAQAQGLGNCILDRFNVSKMKKLSDIPDPGRGVLDIVIGYPAQKIRPKKRKTTEEFVSYNTYRK